VVRYDLRGMGSSDRNPKDLSSPARLLDLEAVVERTGIEKFVLAGRDVSCATAVSYAILHPSRVSALILLSAFTLGGPRYRSNPNAQTVVQIQKLAEQDWPFLALTIANLELGFVNSDMARKMAGAFANATSSDVWAATREVSEKIDLTHLLPRVKVPALVVHEKLFPYVTIDLCREVAGGIAGAQLVSAADVDEQLEAIDGFLRRNAGAILPDGLSTREAQILHLIASGKRNPQIADDLVISLNTVTRHISNIFAKTGLANRTEAAVYAIERGI
jgi:pimeloyl-ACP methyl ester carboxylesterase